MSTMSNVNNVKYQQCQMSTMSNVNNVKCQQYQMSTMSTMPRSVEICPDQLKSYDISLIMSKSQPNCQNANQIIKMSIKLSIKLSKCQSNYQNVNQNVNQIVKLSQYQMSCVIRVCRLS